MDLSIQTLKLEAFLLVLVRTGTFCATAPLFAHRSVNVRLRVLIGACLAIVQYSVLNPEMPYYDTVLAYSFLVIKEAIVGLSIGFIASLCMSALLMAGELIDREIGFSMVTTMNPGVGAMSTITAEMYDKLVYIVIVLNNLHFHIIKALVHSFEVVPLGSGAVNYAGMYVAVVGFIIQLFGIGLRIAMPIFISATILNVVLGILAKSSPQMNMFSVGMQLKVFAGLTVLSLTIMFVPNIATYLMERMQEMLNSFMGGL